MIVANELLLMRLFADGLTARFEVSKCVWPYMVSIGIVYFVTLSLFPGIESEIVSCRLGSWMPIVLIAVFNLFDFIGKVRYCLSFSVFHTRMTHIPVVLLTYLSFVTMLRQLAVRPLILAGLRSRCAHYILQLWFLLLLYLFPRLFSAVGDWMSTILPHMMWLWYEFRMHF